MMNQIQLTYVQEHPFHCKRCGGSGAIDNPNVSFPILQIDCPACIKRSKCPECGDYPGRSRHGELEGLNSDLDTCCCGWRLGEGGMPQ